MPKISTESFVPKPISKARSHDDPIYVNEAARKKSISDFVVKEPVSENQEGATAAATLFMECPKRLFTTTTNKQQEF